MTLARKLLPYIVLVLFFLFETVPLYSKGYIPTHDGEYHITRFMEYITVLRNGSIFPRWAPNFNSGFGIPLFSYHYPFPNYVGAFFQIVGIDAVRAFFLSLGLGYGISLIGCYFFFRKQASAVVSTCLAILFGTVPYLFVDLYVRGSIGEVWGIAWVMTALAAFAWNIPLLFIGSIALLILSHNIMAMLFIPLLGLYVMVMNRKLLPHTILGIFLASYFWIPALFEQKYVQGLNMISFVDHFSTLADILIPSWGTGFSGQGIVSNMMSVQFGIIPVVLMLSSIIAYFFSKKRGKKSILIVISLLIVGFLMLDVSLPLWRLLPFLPLLQYPWRLLSYVVVGTPFLAFHLLKQKPKILVVITALSIVLTYSYARPVIYENRTESFYRNQRNFIDGTSSVGNSFSTIWSSWKSNSSTTEGEVVSGNATLSDLIRTPLASRFTVSAKMDSIVRINRMYFPGWKISIDGNPAEATLGKEGVIEFTVPQGTRQITAWFGPTPFRTIANAFSCATILLIVFLFILPI